MSENGRLISDVTETCDIQDTHFFYKQHFYKQRQAEIDKK